MLALADDPPNLEAIAMSPTVGWALLACGVVIALLILGRRERWRRFWLTVEDPRTMGVLRILIAAIAIANVNSLWEYFEFLFTDEGIFSAGDAQEFFAPKQYKGYNDGSDGQPAGFFGWSGFMQVFTGQRLSLLFFYDSPTAFYAYLAAFELAGILFMLGLWTRVTGIITFVLMNGIFWRNSLFMEGTEVAIRCFFFYLLLARSGHAYSLDNWLRCRKLAKRGELSTRDGPGGGAGLAPCPEHPRGLQAIYRAIPVWPRRLMMLQLATIYTTTGILKNGPTWAQGDAFYYALNLDHFYRFYPQKLSALFGTNLFRVMTWVAHWWEVFFPLVLVGVALRFGQRHELPPIPAGTRRRERYLWTALGLLCLGICIYTLPVHLPDDFPVATKTLQLWIAVVWLVLMLVVGYLGHRVCQRPLTIHIFRREVRLDRDWCATWLFGRRLWLGLGVLFQLNLMVLMNIGLFQPIMLAATLAFFSGREVASALHWVARKLPGNLGQHPPLPSESLELPHHHRDGQSLPTKLLYAGLVVGITGVFVHALVGTSWRVTGLVIGLGLVAVTAWQLRQPAGPDASPLHRPWAYGPRGRLLVGALILVHIVAVALWLVPKKGCTSKFRESARRVFQPWLMITATGQGWGMFAPNPPKTNRFLRVLVVDDEGVEWDMNTDVYVPERKPIPWIFNDRMRKMNRRLLGPGVKYRRWYARYHCRKWAQEHGGRIPNQVRLIKLSYQIPSPEQVAKSGPYIPEDRLRRRGNERTILTVKCAREVRGQLTNEVRLRHGLPEIDPKAERLWNKQRTKKWHKRSQRN